MLRIITALFLTVLTTGSRAQAVAAATRTTNFQVGGSFVNSNSDHARSRFNGYGIYGDADFFHGIGAEAAYHYITDGDPNTHEYQRSYEVGLRYSRHYGRFQPFGKIMVGRGVINYPYNVANRAYNMIAVGGGTDIRVSPHFNGRIEYEYQRWGSFRRDAYSAPTDTLTPDMLSAGFAYRF